MDNIVLGSVTSQGLTQIVGYAMLARAIDTPMFSPPQDPIRIYSADKPAPDIAPAPLDYPRRALDMTVSELQRVMATDLDGRSIMVLTLRYGLDGSYAHPLLEVGKKLDLSRERVRQLQERAITQLRKSVDAWNQEQERAWSAMTGELREQ